MGAPDSRLVWYQAAVLAIGTAHDAAYLSHASAAHLWGWEGCRPAEVIHVISRGHHPRDVGILPHRTKTLPSTHVMERSGIPASEARRGYLPGDYPIELPVWIELDGKFAHSEVLDVNDDRAREDALMRAGWPEPIRLTWQDLVRRPDAVVARPRRGRPASSVRRVQPVGLSGHSTCSTSRRAS